MSVPAEIASQHFGAPAAPADEQHEALFAVELEAHDRRRGMAEHGRETAVARSRRLEAHVQHLCLRAQKSL